TGGTVTFNWTRTAGAIGLAAVTGAGQVPAFVATNAGTAPLSSTFTVTASFSNGGITCVGTSSVTYTITINPTATVNTVPNVITCHNAIVPPTPFSSPNTGGTLTFNWTNSDPTIGLAASGSVLAMPFQIPGFTAVNLGPLNKVATITITPIFTFNGVSCTGTPKTFTITVTPPPVATCQNKTIALGANGQVVVTPSDVSNGSIGGTLSFVVGATTVPSITFTCANLGPNTVTLRVTDGCGLFATCVAIVTIVDNTPPIMTMPPVDNLFANCDEGEAHGCPIPIDNCDQTPSLLFEFHYEPYVGGCTNSYTVVRKWTAGDKCGNTTVAFQHVYVVDQEDPELTCPANIEKSSNTPVSVSWTAPKAHDNCDGALVATQIAGPKSGSTFDPGTTTKITYVTVDNCGNTDTCSFLVTIIKGIIINTGSKISGALKNMNGGGIENAEVDINGDVNQFTTSAGGAYEFKGITKGSNETVSAYKLTNPLEGVNTLDLVFITNHILGKKALNSPFKILAADVNNSKNITTADLVEIRKLILHITDKFTNVDSWQFLPAGTTFASQINPWKDPIVSTIKIDNIQADQVADLSGIKMGDVTWDAVGNASGKIEVKNNEVYGLKAENKEFRKGEEVEMLISGKDLEGMKGLQFTMEYNTANLEYEGIKGIREDISEENFGMRYMESGKITGSIDLRGEKGGDDLFKVIFKAKATGSLLNSIRMTSSLTKAEAYTTTDESTDLSLSFTQNGKEIAITTAVLYQNEPNPFESNTVIRFFVPENQEATLSIYTLDGKILKEMNEVYTKGEHQVSIAKEEFPASGVYYYQLKTNNYTDTKKMMYVK
ncbi:MAG TPA: HYR domain-containing protein, partial [Saprospiraceae bacterium]|nr:HYR domain-containing protein [Saprospiraceae bacterium]